MESKIIKKKEKNSEGASSIKESLKLHSEKYY